MFEKASRMKLRFPYKGMCSVEDLWDLSLEDLDGLYSKLSRESKALVQDSLLKKRNTKTVELDLKIEIVKHVVEVKLAEKDARESRLIKAQQKRKIEEIIERKKDSELEGKTPEELQKILEELG